MKVTALQRIVPSIIFDWSEFAIIENYKAVRQMTPDGFLFSIFKDEKMIMTVLYEKENGAVINSFDAEPEEIMSVQKDIESCLKCITTISNPE